MDRNMFACDSSCDRSYEGLMLILFLIIGGLVAVFAAYGDEAVRGAYNLVRALQS